MLEVHRYDDDPDRAYRMENTVTGPKPNQLPEQPTPDNQGFLRGFQLLVLSFQPSETKDMDYENMRRLPARRYLDASWGTMVHEKLPGDRRSDHARRETLWIDLEDVIASKYVLGQQGSRRLHYAEAGHTP